MKRKGFSILFALVLVLSLGLVMAVPTTANATPVIDGVISSGEWGAYYLGTSVTTWQGGMSVDVYGFADSTYLYAAYEADTNQPGWSVAAGLCISANLDYQTPQSASWPDQGYTHISVYGDGFAQTDGSDWNWPDGWCNTDPSVFTSRGIEYYVGEPCYGSTYPNTAEIKIPLSLLTYAGADNQIALGGQYWQYNWATPFFVALPDTTPPIVSNVLAEPNPVAAGSQVTLTATIDDTNTGGSNIDSAGYSLDGGDWNSMEAQDGTFDEVSEDVEATLTAPSEAGIYNLCVRGTDAENNVSDPECILLVVYDPSAGFVTGGGWIDSPPGAYMPGPTNIEGTFTGDYTSRFTNIQCDPNNTPITFTGSVEVTGIQPNGAVMIGLVDQGLYDSGPSVWGTWGSGAYLYLGRIGTNVRIGPSDGFMGGELNQVGANVPYVDGGPNLIEFSMTIYEGQITVTYGGVDYVDTYGGIEDMNTTDAYSGSEFDSGAYVGLDSYPADNTVVYDINISGCPSGPTGKASFGFVAKYKKGANIPDGQTEFVFKAAGLNFHSSSYDWLVITGSDYAKFKGTGTINGMGDYKFMLWAGDGTGTDGADTFRIKIWEEDESGNETVIYDNGMDQAIGGGSIVVHKK